MGRTRTSAGLRQHPDWKNRERRELTSLPKLFDVTAAFTPCFRESEEDEEEEEEEEGEGEEEDESDTHEEEEEELDEIDMEVSYTSHHPQRSSPTDLVSPPVSIRMVNATNITRYP
ncbi:histone H3.v1-like isoform X2 [Odontomachus brunneus]|uniref:histone H3.v1-like isoform X2 n=1 Tax=Odontomachus brunneus TaxID=486640 RepID=UPI0013F23CDB|nr:histone H3.v1-like isoform X2 [Odontomachus brunneus]